MSAVGAEHVAGFSGRTASRTGRLRRLSAQARPAVRAERGIGFECFAAGGAMLCMVCRHVVSH